MSLSEHWKETLGTAYNTDDMSIHLDKAQGIDHTCYTFSRGLGKSSMPVIISVHNFYIHETACKLIRMDRIPRKTKKKYKKNKMLWSHYLTMKENDKRLPDFDVWSSLWN